MRLLLAGVVLAALSGCTNTTDKVLRNDACIKSHVEVRLIMMPRSQYCGKGCNMVTVQPMFIPVTECDQHLYTFYPNPNYKPGH